MPLTLGGGECQTRISGRDVNHDSHKVSLSSLQTWHGTARMQSKSSEWSRNNLYISYLYLLLIYHLFSLHISFCSSSNAYLSIDTPFKTVNLHWQQQMDQKVWLKNHHKSYHRHRKDAHQKNTKSIKTVRWRVWWCHFLPNIIVKVTRATKHAWIHKVENDIVSRQKTIGHVIQEEKEVFV